MTVSIMVDGEVIQVANDDPRAPVPVPPPSPVPVSVSALAAKLALEHAGLLSQVQTAVQAAGGDVVVWFDEAQHWQRQHPYVLQLAGTMNLSSDQVDTLFEAAGAIDVANA